MGATWIVSANASRARFFSQAHSSDRLEEISDMVNPAAHLRTAETEPDRLGLTAAVNSQHSAGGGAPGKTYEPHQTPAAHHTELFARNVAAALLQAHQEDRFQRLFLIASPQFLGVLRKLLGPRLEPLVKLEINKDYTQDSPMQLREQIEAHKAKA